MPLCWYLVKRQDLPPQRPLSVMVQAVPENDASPTFENTGDPLLLIGRGSGRRRRDDRVVSFDVDSFQ